MRFVAIAMSIFFCSTAFAAVVTGGSVSGGTVTALDPVFIRTEGLQTNTVELDRFAALSVSGQYATDLASVTSHATTARDSWPYTITAGAWDGLSNACEPVGATGVGNQYDSNYMASDIFAMALAGYLNSDDTMFAEVKTRLEEFQAITDIGPSALGNQCILDFGSAAYHLVEAALLMEEAGYASWTTADRLAFAEWLAEVVFPVVDAGIHIRKNNWGIVAFGSALAIAAYTDGGIPILTEWDGGTISPAAYLTGFMTPLAKWMSDSSGDELDSECAAAYNFGFQTNGSFPDDLRRPAGTAVADCNAASIAAHSTDGGCSSSTSCDQNGGHFYSQKSTNALVRVAEIMRRLGDAAVFEMDTHAGGDPDIIAAAKFTSGAAYQTWLIQDTTQGYRYVAGEYYEDSALLAALASGPSVSVRGGRDYAYTRITHAPGVAYPLPAEAFTSLAESSLFGNGGSIFDLTTRIPDYDYLPGPPANSTYATTVDLRASPCNSDTRTTLLGLINGSAATAADSTHIRLPNTCFLDEELTDGAGDTFAIQFYDARDNIKLSCDTATCGLRSTLTPGAYSDRNSATLLRVGQNRTSGIGSACNLLEANYSWGSKVVEAEAGCSVTAMNLGPGDIVRLKTSRITGYGQITPEWMTRIEGFTDDSGNCLGVCTSISGPKKFQLQNVPPMSIKPDAYFWGNEGLGSFFTKHSTDSGGPSNYAATTGATLTLIERVGSSRCGIVSPGSCGVGAETENIAEDIWFENVNFTVGDNVLGTRYFAAANMYGGGFYGGQVLRTVGRASAFTFGGAVQDWTASHVSMHSMDWLGTGFNGKCSGEIIAISAGATVTVDVRTYSETDCSDDDGVDPDDPDWNEPEVMFSWDVVDSRLAGKRFRVTTAYVGGSPVRERMTLTGLSGTDPDGTGVPINTTVAGQAIQVDRYGGASYYTNEYSSYIQVINNAFLNPGQHAISQGCFGCVYAANYVDTDPALAEVGRGPFKHGDRGGSGNIHDLNDQDQAMILIDSGNGENLGALSGHGEGVNNAYCFNRKRTSPTPTWPLGAAVGTNYASDVAIALLNTGQNGAVNDSWSFVGNSAQTSLWQGTIDDCDNNAGDAPNDGLCVNAQQPNVPPAGQLFEPAGYRNRCATCNQDANWEASTGSPNYGTPYTDVRSSEYGDSSPTAIEPFLSERSGMFQSCFFEATPSWWCVESGFVGQMGASYDDWTTPANNKKLPAQIRIEGGTCTPVVP